MAKAAWQKLIIRNGEKAWRDAGRRARVDRMPEKRRNKVLDGIDRTLAQIRAGDDAPKRGWYVIRRHQSGGQDIAKVTVRLGQRPLVIEGANSAYIPAGQVTEFYQAVREDVASGELDTNIAALFQTPTANVQRRQKRQVRNTERTAPLKGSRR